MDSILDSIKKKIGIEKTDKSFDDDITMTINSALSIATQLGVGPAEGFLITGNVETWEELIGTRKDLEIVKDYVYMKVKLVFDPPTSSAVMDAFQTMIKEYEFRINIIAETKL